MEIIRRKVQIFEEVDIDRISEFVTMTSEGRDPDHGSEHQNELSDNGSTLNR